MYGYSGGIHMENNHSEFRQLKCPCCHAQAGIQIFADTILINFHLYCPHCKETSIITLSNFEILFPKREKL